LVHRLARIVFPYYWECLSLAAAVGEWSLACWALGPPRAPVWHAASLVVLFLLNRLATVAYELEDTAAPIRHRTGGVVLAAGFSCAGGTAGLVVAALAWAVIVRAGGLSAQAGTATLVAHEWLGPEFGAVGWIGITTGFGLVVDGYLRGYRRLAVTRLAITLPSLPSRLDGFRIVQVSDLHLGPIAHRATLRAALDAAVAEDADLLVVTGDVVDSAKADLRAWLPELARLRARHGVVAILGNHDDDAGLARVEAALRAATDWTLLRDAIHTVEVDAAVLHLVGLDFRRGPHEGDAVAALAARLPDDAAVVLLAHDPNAFRAAVEAGLPLTLAGHTHGGQIALPLAPRWNPARLLMTPYDAGTFVERGCILHVNRGLGTSGQRLRIGAAREITVVTLRAPGASDTAS
jgi:predicted MPP superfamily phosphohydrolase